MSAFRYANRPQHQAAAPGKRFRAWAPCIVVFVSIVGLAPVPANPIRPACAATGTLELVVVDRKTGERIPCRMHLRKAGSSRPRRPSDRRLPYWHDHFVFPGTVTLRLPLGTYEFELERGPEYVRRSGHFVLQRFSDDSKQVDLLRFADMAAEGWWSGDLDVRRPQGELELLLQAEDLHLVPALAATGSTTSSSGSLPQELRQYGNDRFVLPNATVRQHPGGELILFNLRKMPQATDPQQEVPSLLELAQRVHEQGGWVDLSRPYWWDLPLLVAHRQVDSIEVLHSDFCRGRMIDHSGGGKSPDRSLFPGTEGLARWSQAIYFHLLNCGLRIPPTAGSGSGKAPNPAGYNRLYVHVKGPFTCEKWWENLRKGQVVITNGPLLLPQVEGELPGHVFTAEAGQVVELDVALTLHTRDPISYLEIIKNGEVEYNVRFDEYARNPHLPKIRFERSGWFLLRAVNDVTKTYRFAMTGPYYVEVGYQPRISRRSAQFFLDWVYERARQIARLPDPEIRRRLLEEHRVARDYWQDLVRRANGE